MDAEWKGPPAPEPTEEARLAAVAAADKEAYSLGFLSHWRGILRVCIGVIGGLAILLAAAAGTNEITAQASAVQVIQVYVGHIEDVLVITAVCVVLYILSRAGD